MAYLMRLDIREAMDELVVPHLVGAPAVVVGHPLGTIVAYVNLVNHERTPATMLAALGVG